MICWGGFRQDDKDEEIQHRDHFGENLSKPGQIAILICFHRSDNEFYEGYLDRVIQG